MSIGIFVGEVSVYGIGELIREWELDSVVTAAVACPAIVYIGAWSRLVAQRRNWPTGRLVVFAAGVVVLLVAIDGPPDVLSDVSLSAHMVQHLLVILVAAPLLLLGAPVTLLLRADPPWLPRRLVGGVVRSRAAHLVSHPVFTFGLFTVVLVGSHLSPLYNLALESEPLHQAEHAAYLVSALLFWWPAIGTDPAPSKPPHAARLLYLLLAMPVMALLGVAIASTDQLLYSSYASNPPPWGATALQDQHLAGTIMWIGAMFTMPAALGLVLMRWLNEDERDENRLAIKKPTVHIGDSSRAPTPEGAR